MTCLSDASVMLAPPETRGVLELLPMVGALVSQQPVGKAR